MTLRAPPARPPQRGFTLLEMAIILVIVGMLVAGVMQGQQLIQNARVRSLIAEQDAAATAVIAFQDRYKALPGDYAEAHLMIPCVPACPSGNGNGRVEDTTTPSESILAWAHMSGAGLLNGNFTATSSTTTVTPENAPRNATGGFLQIAFDNKWGYSANPARRHNIKTGNNVAVEILAEVDRKIDDGLPASGRFQFSTYAADADAPTWGAGGTHCLTADGSTAAWNVGGGQVNCGAATLL